MSYLERCALARDGVVRQFLGDWNFTNWLIYQRLSLLQELLDRSILILALVLAAVERSETINFTEELHLVEMVGVAGLFVREEIDERGVGDEVEHFASFIAWKLIVVAHRVDGIEI